MSTGKAVGRRRGFHQSSDKLDVSETLPAVVVTSEEDSKRTSKLNRNKQTSFTSLYRKAVIDKDWSDQMDMSEKEMEFMGLLPSTCPRKFGTMCRHIRKSESSQKKFVAFSLSDEQVWNTIALQLGRGRS